MGRPLTQFRPTYLKHATQLSGRLPQIGWERTPLAPVTDGHAPLFRHVTGSGRHRPLKLTARSGVAARATPDLVQQSAWLAALPAPPNIRTYGHWGCWSSPAAPEPRNAADSPSSRRPLPRHSGEGVVILHVGRRPDLLRRPRRRRLQVRTRAAARQPSHCRGTRHCSCVGSGRPLPLRHMRGRPLCVDRAAGGSFRAVTATPLTLPERRALFKH